MTSVIVSKRKEAAVLTINRPEQRNAINYDVMDKLMDSIKNAEEDERVKYIILTGSGEKAFCSGGDLNSFYDLRTEQQAYPMLRKMGDVLDRLFFCKKPTVALLNGHAVGGGSELAIACDFRIARSDIQVGFIQGSIGLTTGWGGATYTLTRMDSGKALQMLMSADRYSAEMATENGYLTYITKETNWQNEAYDYIEKLLKRSPLILSSYKNYWLSSLDETNIRKRVENEISNCATLWATDEHHQAVEVFLSKKNR